MKKHLWVTFVTILFIIVVVFFVYGYQNHELITDPPSGPLKWWSNTLAFWIVFAYLATFIVVGHSILEQPPLPGDPWLSSIALLLFIVLGAIAFVTTARGWKMAIVLSLAQAGILYLLYIRCIRHIT